MSTELSNTGRCFEYRIQVGFEETNVVGNVYFANYFVWQGKCREMFLSIYAPQVLEDFANGHGMITKESSCSFSNESYAFDQLLIKMRLTKLSRASITMGFDYYRESNIGTLREDERQVEQPVLLATGIQSTIWASPGQKISMLPDYLYNAVKQFSSADTKEA